jgi:SAM-dependent methyltransferase
VSSPARARDPYVAYLHRFFHRWLPYYDLFARCAAPVYAAVVRRVAPRPGRVVLDLCTGTGEVALRCARRGAEVTGIDITSEMLDRARRKAGGLPLALRLMDARRLAFADSSFDAAVLCFALHDMPRRVRLEVLAEAARVARERLVVADYALPRGWLGRKLLLPLVRLFETAYFPGFAAEGLEPLLAEAGLAASEVSRRGWPFFAVWVIPLKGALRPGETGSAPGAEA